VVYKAEYIWVDGTQPTSKLRSKTKILEDGAELPIWGFDGSSTSQATGDKSDCVLKPVASYPDPIRGGDDVLVMCEVMLVDGKPHPTNTRHLAAKTEKKYKKHEPLFGIEQEFTLMKNGRPYGFPPAGYPEPQGGYYCGVGEDEIHGRPLVDLDPGARRTLVSAGSAGLLEQLLRARGDMPPGRPRAPIVAP